MYFVLTVFTTVGFGDISAFSVAEIIYAVFTMLIGAVAHSIIMGEMINTLTVSDRQDVEVAEQKELIKGFAEHTMLGEKIENSLSCEVVRSTKTVRCRFDREQMKKVLASNGIPRDLMGELSREVFEGELIRNRFLCTVNVISNGATGELSPRLPLLIAVAVQPCQFEGREIIYHKFDHPWFMFLVLSGVFAYVASADKNTQPSCSLHQTNGLNAAGADQARGALPGELPRFSSNSSKKRDVNDGKQTLYPYQIFGPRGYFGEFEVLLGTGPRTACARCESEEGGVALVLHKKDIHPLLVEFPRFGFLWRLSARRREERRKKKLSELKGKNYKAVAAATIQAAMRRRRERAQQRLAKGSITAIPEEKEESREVSGRRKGAAEDVIKKLNGVVSPMGGRGNSRTSTIDDAQFEATDERMPEYAVHLRADVACLHREVDLVRNTLDGLRKDMAELLNRSSIAIH